MQTAPVANFKPYLLSVEDSEKACFVGVYDRFRVELINGQVVSPKVTDAVFAALIRLNKRLVRGLSSVATVVCRCPVKIFEYKREPDPDFSRIAHENYKARVPEAKETALLIEVSGTPQLEQTVKLPLYAKAKVPEVWLLDVVDNELEVYTDPQDDEYLTRCTFKPQEAVASKAFPEIPIEWW